MDINYKRIIREEINRLILSETIDVSPLAKYMQPLKKYAEDIKNLGFTKNKEIDAFLNDLCTYIFQVIFAIDRCVKANSLNEDFRLSDYGVQYPSELGGNLWNDFENGLYKGANWARGKLYKNGYIGNNGNGANANGNGANANGNPNTNQVNSNPNNIPSVKLSELVNNSYAQISLRFQGLASKYPNELSNHSNIIIDALQSINQVKREYMTIQQNAQGTNP